MQFVPRGAAELGFTVTELSVIVTLIVQDRRRVRRLRDGSKPA